MPGKTPEHWQERGWQAIALLPLTGLFCVLAAVRRGLYRLGLKRVQIHKVAVIVVGNISVGGSGKTPFVTWLAEQLLAAGYRPGIVLRGYGGKAHNWPQQVRADSDSFSVGDEAVLLASRTGCPVCAGPDRVADVCALVEHSDCDVVISDDGMQHYRMGRAMEIAIVDGQRRFGNRWCLPSGPLREPVKRLEKVDWTVVNGRAESGEYSMRLVGSRLFTLDRARQQRLSDLEGQTVHAVAGIGHPERFFASLRHQGLTVIPHPFPDHHAFEPADLDYADAAIPVLMTEKDAVKCAAFAQPHWWFLPVEAKLDEHLGPLILDRLRTL